MSVDIDATTDLLLLIQQKLRIVQYRYGSFPFFVEMQIENDVQTAEGCKS